MKTHLFPHPLHSVDTLQSPTELEKTELNGEKWSYSVGKREFLRNDSGLTSVTVKQET